jgi:hypothetical protein
MRKEDALRKAVIFPVLLLLLQVACGGGSGLPASSAVSVDLVPPTATIPVGQTVDLRGTATGFTQPTLSWWEQDQHDTAVNGSGEEDCDYINDANSNLIATCRFGYLTGSGMVQASTETATYHAPMTPGVYHLTFRAFEVSVTQVGSSLEKRATATITVTQ